MCLIIVFNYIRIIDEVLQKKDEIFANVESLMETIVEEEVKEVDTATKATELLGEFNKLLSKTRTQLMSKEVILHDQLEVWMHYYNIYLIIEFRKILRIFLVKDINEVFKHNIMDMVSSFLQNAQKYFSNLRNAEAAYNDNINRLILCYLDSLDENEASVLVHFVGLCRDKDTLTTTLVMSHDVHVQVRIEN